MLAFDAVQATIEEAGATAETEEGKSVGEGLEERLGKGFECLAWLGIMIHDEGLSTISMCNEVH
jgi:hypothetical protein